MLQKALQRASFFASTIPARKRIFIQICKGHNLNRGILLYDALGWEVRMPKYIHGLKGSCLVIPCSFSYTSYPPKDPRRVVWYQWVSKGYPLVYDPWHPNDVIEKFRWKTDLYGDPSNRDCSLLIKNLQQSHHEEKLYAWIDPENVGWRTYAFYDVTSTIQVDDITEGVAKNFICSVYHSCQNENPTITWNYENMQVSEWNKTLSGLNQVTYSNITFLGAKVDHEKKLIYPVLIGLETIGLYILMPSLVFLLVCILAGVIIYKKRQRSKDAMSGNKPFSKPHMPSPKSYTSYPPKDPRRVVWYQYVSKGYPLVYDPWYPDYVIEKFRWKTDLYGDPSSWDCSLLIKNLEQSHHGEKLYTWIDPENVGKSTYAFYDVTSTIQVDASPQLPSISIFGGERTGDAITVVCSGFHTCPYSKPTITLNGLEGSDQIKDESIKDGLWKITRTRKGVVKTERLTIQCSVTHYGGITVTATKDKSAECVHQKITIEPELADVTEGVAKIFTCSVYHSCQKEPTITWNYENMPITKGSKTRSDLNQVTYSHITFLGAKDDHGKKLICTANFSGGKVTTSVVLRVQCVHYNISIEPELADVTEGVAKNFTCSVYHSCQKEPTITWNYENMPITKGSKTRSDLNQVTYSDITFLGAKEDHGKKLTCTANFSGGNIITSVVLCIQFVLLYDALGWDVRMPKEIHGLKGSCLVIPCSFSYTLYPPQNPARIVWYQYVSRGYPLVYDPCLLIRKLEQYHHGEKLYAWIDPENVGKSTYVFYDVTSTIKVDESPQQPNISIYGGEKMGDTVTVICSTFHTCPYSKPTITLNGLEGSDQIDNEHIKDGLWKITLTRKGVVKAERLNIQCSVRHYGGITVTATKDKSAKCVHQKITIEPELTDVTVGIAKNFVCSVYHSCQKENPTITWNYKNMQVTTTEKTHWGLNRLIYSNIAFLATKEDNGKKLICTAKFSGGDITASVILHVKLTPQQPSISVSGGERTGDTIIVECSTFHTCPYSKPAITLDGIEGSDEIKDESVKDGLLKITLTRTGVVKAESTTIECSVTHYGGITVTATEVKSSKCVHHNISIEPELADVTEGVAQNFTCTIYHSCQNENPTITWNYENMQVSSWNKKHSDLDQFRIAFSNITFLGAKEDHGKRLICTATFSGGNIETYVVLRVQAYFQYVADVIPKITALPRSCVVIPCSFKTDEEYTTELRVLWVTRKGGYMFHTDPVNVSDNFKGRTRLLGNPVEQNCTVEMDNVQTHDNGPFCFRAERENERYGFNNSCVFIIMRAPDKPVMSSLPEDIEPGTRVSVQCSVNHTCSSHPPEITWSVPTDRETISHNHMGGGVWETVSAVTFIPTGYEEKDEIVCTAKFWGGKTQENTAFLSIRRLQRLKLEDVGLYAVVPSLVFILIFVLAGVLICRRWHRANNTCIVSGNKPFSKPHMPSPKRVMILIAYMEMPDESIIRAVQVL
ncbi:hypothetical protein cypCar_00035090 [Cyprinus carpio]|nr:hypothetical protein cypCar_00035090 [Cyprinus carpio]